MSGAEALAVIGIIANVVQLVEFSREVIDRTQGFRNQAREIPEVFRDVESQLPVIVNALHKIQRLIESGNVSEETCSGLKAVATRCQKKVTDLRSIFKDTLPADGASVWNLGKKALLSMGQDKKVKLLSEAILRDVQALSFFQVAEGATSAQVEAIKNSVEAAIAKTTLPTEPTPPPRYTRANSSFILPYARNLHFVGQEDQLEDICRRLEDKETHHRVVLVGLGGIGKSQIALEFAFRYHQASPENSVYWIHAADAARFEHDYLQIGIDANLKGMTNPNQDPKQLVKAWLSSSESGRWLLIIDNADYVDTFFKPMEMTAHHSGVKTLSEYLPKCSNGSIIITTRNKKAGIKFDTASSVIVLGKMDPADAEELFRVRKGTEVDEKDKMKELLENLEYLPLAISQAASYIAENDISISEYLQMYTESEKNSIELLSEQFEEPGRDSSAMNPIAAVWAISFEQIRQQDALATKLLSFMACLDRKAIPKALLPSESSVRLSKSLGLLKAYSLITAAKRDELFEIHRLVHLAMRNWLRMNGGFEIWAKACLDLVLEEFPSGDHGTLERCDLYEPHAQALLSCDELSSEHDCHRACLAQKVSLYLLNRGRYSTAERVASNAVRWRERAFGHGHLDCLASVSNLALIVGRQGKYEKAYKMHNQTLQGRLRILGADHLDTLTSVGHVAEMLRKMGRYQEAQNQLRRALDKREFVQGKNHPETLSSVDDLAWVLLELGEYTEAESLQRRALSGRQQEWGLLHPETLASLSDLAIVLRKKGDFETAEKLQRRALEGRQMVLGHKHPHTLWSKSDLGAALRKLGKLEEAMKYHQEALQGRKEVLGNDHRYTLWSMSDLALVLLEQGDIDGAENLHKQALKGRERMLGRDHPDTLASLSNLAVVLQHRGDLEEAEALHQRALDGRIQVLGENHPATLSSREKLAEVYQFVKRMIELNPPDDKINRPVTQEKTRTIQM